VPDRPHVRGLDGRIGTWWPADHTVTGDDDLAVVLEPRRGGRIFERTRDGVEHDWGEVTIWEPPTRLGYTWHLRRDRADATDVGKHLISCAEGQAAVGHGRRASARRAAQ
jgi:hypothetical protein